MLQPCTQHWKSFKLLNVCKITLKPMSTHKWRDTKRLQMTHLLPGFRMNISSSKRRSVEANNSFSLNKTKKIGKSSMIAFMLISSLHLATLRCADLRSATCLWILNSSKYCSQLFIWIMFFKSWSWQMMRSSIATLQFSKSSVRYFATTELAPSACLTLVETFTLSMTLLRRIKHWLKRWKSRRQAKWRQMQSIMD